MQATISLLLLSTALLLSACVSQGTYNQQVQKTDTYQKLDAQLKGELGRRPGADRAAA